MSIDDDKCSDQVNQKYILRNAVVYQSSNGYTFSKYLDPLPDGDKPDFMDEGEREKLHRYLETQLQFNHQRLKWQVELLKSTLNEGSKVLDVGCGGGAFLLKAKQSGFEVEGLELDVNRASYSSNVVGCVIHGIPVDNESFISSHREYYDAVTLWDVIEHVNFPVSVIKSIYSILKPGGYLFIDTPAKDGFYHQFGDITYKLTVGKVPTFLNIMYSDHLFGHKQIFSTNEMSALLSEQGFNVISLAKFHELSFPYEFYLNKLLKNEQLAKGLSPFADIFFKIFKLKNKMKMVGRKPMP